MSMETAKLKIKGSASFISELTGKALGGLRKFTGKLDPLIKVPIVGEAFADVQDIVYMLDDYYRGHYKKVPITAILGCIAIIGYVASPIDLVPDSVPILGFLDDAFIIKFIVELCIDKELEKYRKWREENNT